ncbi:tlg2p-like protein a [Actinidia eriantha]|uniref:tlg2p-like protein a n=1 Tax=Actinidia eriantha TaxID=165200 RepID=UPI00258DC46D|nr:tlg2p-like protein a [Actinidia eriantha]XP_057483054.1 tlg2p-like protein a [Actinidia eriantha]XP_057483055.1 tlg2p-like protein a [Actinidia eriantha]
MATRNRTVVFRRYRHTLNSNRFPEASSSSSHSNSTFGGPVIEMATASFLRSNRTYAPLSTEEPGLSSQDAFTVGLSPDWVDVSEEITANIQRIRVKMTELVKAHAKALTPSFEDGKEDQRVIEALTLEITHLLRKSEKRLRKLSVKGPAEDANIRKNVQHSLATDLQTLSMELRKKQSTYLKRLQQQKEGHDGLDLEMNLNEKISRSEVDEFGDVGFSEHQMAKLKMSENFSVEREREIRQVLESVNELAQIMKDLSVLVIDQGTIVDRIDYNIQNVAVSVEEGFKQLQKAERSQAKGGMVRCATVLVIMCFVMLVLLVLKTILL